MTKEPSNSNAAEPKNVPEKPLGESGTAEPVVLNEEPESKDSTSQEPSKEEPEKEEKEASYQDLKTVPTELQPIAKKMQAQYTKDMQALKKIRDEVGKINPVQPEYGYGPPNSEEVQQVKEFMQSPQGGALKEVVEEIVGDRIGDLPQKVNAAEADKEIDAAIAKYGKSQIDEHYDEIQDAISQFPTVPLDMICSHVLYDNAKESGKSELRKQFDEKSKKSIEFGGTSPVSAPSTRAKTIEEAFKQAADKT
jgi:hypothetical protein